MFVVVGVLFRIGLMRLVLGWLVCVFVCGVRVVAFGVSAFAGRARSRLRFGLVVGCRPQGLGQPPHPCLACWRAVVVAVSVCLWCVAVSFVRSLSGQ